MTSDEAIAWWYGRIDFERKPAKPGDLKLDRMRALLRALGDPHRRLRIVHVAGTKGKGSTSAMLASVLRAAGYRVGLFTSPHLVDVTERIQVDGVPISREELAARMVEVAAASRAIDQGGDADRAATFFEVGTALGFLHFVYRHVDVAIVEVGLGGRFDSTNVCDPLLSIITNISFDHMAQLGDRLALIAREKAGIIKRGRPVVTTAETPEALAVIERIAAREMAPLYALGREFSFEYRAGRISSTEYGVRSTEYAVPRAEYGVRSTEYAVPRAEGHVDNTEFKVPPAEKQSLNECLRSDPDAQYSVLGTPYSVPGIQSSVPGTLGVRLPQVRVRTAKQLWPWMDLGLFGQHQAANAAGVVAVVEVLRREGLTIEDRALARGLANVFWPARLEIAGSQPLILLDCAHNVASAQALVDTMRDSIFVTGKKHLVFAISNDKQVAELLEVLAPHFDHFHLTRYGNNPRCLPPETAAALLRAVRANVACSLHDNAADALQAARLAVRTDGMIIVSGSVFLAGEVRPLLVGS